MTPHNNINIPSNMLLDPMLSELVHKLLLDKPNWFFRATSTRQLGNTYSHALRNGTTVPEGFRFIREVDVVQDGRVAGNLSVALEYRYRGDDRINYITRSDRIDNGRRGTAMRTTKLDTAARNAKKFFAPPQTSEILFEALDNARAGIHRAIHNLAYPIARDHVFRNLGTVAQFYLHAQFTGQPVDPTDEELLRKAFLATEFTTNVEKYLLAQAMQDRTYTIVQSVEGSYCYFTDDVVYDTLSKEEAVKLTVKSCDFEELPDDWQNKLAVLQLMNDEELVLDVGFRYRDSVFLLVTN